MWLILALACNRGPQEPVHIEPIAEPSGPVDNGSATQRKAEGSAIVSAELATKALGSTMRERVSAAMKEGGSLAAIPSCQSDAATLTAAAGSKHVRVGRSSAKLRNPANAGPEWVQDWLQGNQDKRFKDVTGTSDIVDGEARLIRPIQVEPSCLGCHGSHIDQATQTALTAAYPQDKATGYAAGDLRGAVWAIAQVQAAE
jgi:hypothetical protein